MPIAAEDLDFENRIRLLMLGEAKHGKAQPLTEPVLTPKGWRPIGKLQVGDEVIGSSGRPVVVTGVFPQGVKPLVRVQLDDGAWTLCCKEHLWYTTTRNELKRKGEGNVKTAERIAETIHYGHYAPALSGAVRFSYEPRDLPLPPYYLGLLLGDGCFRNESITWAKPDEELLVAIEKYAEALGDRAVRYQSPERCIAIRITKPKEEYGHKVPSHTRAILQELLLDGKYSNEKFIPYSYKFEATPEQRLELLRGLCDTDGYATLLGVWKERGIERATQCEFSTSSSRLRDDVIELVRSLGGRAFPREKEVNGELYWSVAISFRDGTCPFKLERKARVWASERERQWRPRIVAVEEVGEAECVCISIDAPDSLYVTRGHLLTHNTTCAVATSPGPVRVLLCEDISALREAKRRSPRGHFDVEPVGGWNSMQKALAEAKEDAKEGRIKTLVIDPLSDFADKLLAECFKLTLTKEGNEDGRKAYPECTKRLKHVLEQLFAMPCHVIVISHHMVTGGDMAEGIEKVGEGIVPLLPGAARRVVGAKFVDVVWFEMKLEKGPDGKPVEKRSIVCGPKGAWTYGCRSLPGAEVLPDNITGLIERFNKQLREDKRPAVVKPALRPVVNNNARR